MQHFQSRGEELASEFASQASTVEELNALMRLMLKSGLEWKLSTETDVHLGRRSGGESTTNSSTASAGEKRRSPNRRIGRSKKTVQGDLGEVTLAASPSKPNILEPVFFGGTRP